MYAKNLWTTRELILSPAYWERSLDHSTRFRSCKRFYVLTRIPYYRKLTNHEISFSYLADNQFIFDFIFLVLDSNSERNCIGEPLCLLHYDQCKWRGMEKSFLWLICGRFYVSISQQLESVVSYTTSCLLYFSAKQCN